MFGGVVMKYPCLIEKRLCKTNIDVSVAQEGTGNYGVPLTPVTWSGLCNYQDKAKTIFTDDKKVIVASGVALMPGDIAPSLPTLSGGTATINGKSRTIVRGVKARNPDGTVNFTELDLE